MELENAGIKDKNGIKIIKSPFKKTAVIERRLSNVILNRLRAIFRNEELTEEVKKIDLKKYFGNNKVEIVINEDNISKKGIMYVYEQIGMKKIKNNEIEEAINEIKEIIKRIIVSEDYTNKNIHDTIEYWIGTSKGEVLKEVVFLILAFNLDDNNKYFDAYDYLKKQLNIIIRKELKKEKTLITQVKDVFNKLLNGV